MSNNTSDSTQETPDVGGLNAEIAKLSSLLTSQELDISNVDDLSVNDLLERLTTADGVAKGVESKLDDILGHLDKFLASLEAETQKTSDVAMAEDNQKEMRSNEQST